MKRVVFFGLIMILIGPMLISVGYSESGSVGRFGLLTDPRGIVPDSVCAECHPDLVELMHKKFTGVGQAKTVELTQGIINLAVECQSDGKDTFTCRPQPAANCFRCHALSVTPETVSQIDLAKMKEFKKDDEILGHGCLTCHRPQGSKDHHLTGDPEAITTGSSEAFMNGCGSCHAEGLSKITGGGAPHDWLAQHLELQQSKDQKAPQ